MHIEHPERVKASSGVHSPRGKKTTEPSSAGPFRGPTERHPKPFEATVISHRQTAGNKKITQTWVPKDKHGKGAPTITAALGTGRGKG